MKKTAILLAAAAALSAGAAFAQYPSYQNDPDWAARQRAYDDWRWQHRDDDRYRDERWRDPRFAQGDWECWNPHAGHFEGVRPGEVQNDLDFSRCRPRGGALQPYPGYGYGWR